MNRERERYPKSGRGTEVKHIIMSTMNQRMTKLIFPFRQLQARFS